MRLRIRRFHVRASPAPAGPPAGTAILPRETKTMPSLVVLSGTDPGRSFPLRGDRTVLGRDPACDVVIVEATVRRDRAASRASSVSRRHAVIVRADGKYHIEDGDGHGNKSRNGTYVNDQPV